MKKKMKKMMKKMMKNKMKNMKKRMVMMMKQKKQTVFSSECVVLSSEDKNLRKPQKRQFSQKGLAKNKGKREDEGRKRER